MTKKRDMFAGKTAAAVVAITLILSGCGGDEKPQVDAPKSQQTPEHSTTVVGDSRVLATVNGEPVTESDVELTIRRTFSQAEQILLNEQVRGKVTQSLVASKAIKQAAQNELSADQVNDIHQRAKAYEEELFVQAYLREKATPEPVTMAMVKDYYDQHPERFGGITERQFELLSASGSLDDEKRDALLGAMSRIKAESNWSSKTSDWHHQFDLNYQKGVARPGLLDQALENALTKLEPGQSSDVIFIKNIPHVVRLSSTRQLSPKPLSEVSSDIRKILAPLQLRKAVKTVSEAIVAKAKVEYKSE